MNRLAIVLNLVAILATSCSGASPEAAAPTLEPLAEPAPDAFVGSTASTGPLLILVASSAREPVEELAADWSAASGVEVKVSAGASNTLARQVQEGAPAQLFLSASQEWADTLAADGLSLESAPLLGNRLVVVVPKGNTLAAAGDLTGDAVEHLALAGEEVPAGKYAQQSLTSLGLWDALQAPGKIVRGADVRATLAFVEQGEADAGIVYATDARASDQVDVAFTLDEATHDPVVYPLVLLAEARGRPEARSLYEFLQSEAGWVVFQRYGFSRAEAESPASP